MEEFARLEALQHEVQAEIVQFRAADRLGREEVHDRAVHQIGAYANRAIVAPPAAAPMPITRPVKPPATSVEK
jgi:hypothetical protein